MLKYLLRQRFQLQLDAVVKTQARQLFSWPRAIIAPLAILCSHIHCSHIPIAAPLATPVAIVVFFSRPLLLAWLLVRP